MDISLQELMIRYNTARNTPWCITPRNQGAGSQLTDVTQHCLIWASPANNSDVCTSVRRMCTSSPPFQDKILASSGMMYGCMEFHTYIRLDDEQDDAVWKPLSWMSTSLNQGSALEHGKPSIPCVHILLRKQGPKNLELCRIHTIMKTQAIHLRDNR